MNKNIFSSLLLKLFIFISCFFLIEKLLNILNTPDYLFPRPTQVLSSCVSNFNELSVALMETTQNTLCGLLLSLMSGLILAILVSLSTKLRRLILPVALFFQTVPIIAIAPMLVIWFGFGAPTIIASATIVSFFPILASTLQGLESTPKAALDLFKMYQANLWQLYIKLKIPSDIPFILNGVKISLGLAIVGTIVGEFIGGGGLGSLIDSARTQQRTDLVFSAILFSCGLGWILTTLLNLIQKYFFRPCFT